MNIVIDFALHVIGSENIHRQRESWPNTWKNFPKFQGISFPKREGSSEPSHPLSTDNVVYSGDMVSNEQRITFIYLFADVSIDLFVLLSPMAVESSCERSNKSIETSANERLNVFLLLNSRLYRLNLSNETSTVGSRESKVVPAKRYDFKAFVWRNG